MRAIISTSCFAGCAAILVTALAFASPEARGATLRVDGTTGSDGFGCGSEVAPCASIQQAVNLAGTGDSILVAAGTYTYDVLRDPCSSETGVVCLVGKHLSILGGFPQGDWVNRDPAANPTVIDGENLHRGFLVQRASPTSPSASLVLEGFTLTRGRAEGSPAAPEDRRGGGLKAGLLDSIALRDIVFDSNVAAGANTVSNDGGNGAGGGASISNSPDLPRTEVTLQRVQFLNNQALGASGPVRGGLALGGALFVDHANLQAFDVVFANNMAVAGTSGGTGVAGGLTADALGGGMAILSDTTATFEGVTATGNSTAGGSSAGNGGVGAGGAFYVESSSLLLRDGEIRGNSTVGGAADKGGLATGGGLTSFASSVTFERIALIANHATGGDGPTTKGSVGGGAVYVNSNDMSGITAAFLNSIVSDNRIDLGTGGGLVGGGGAGIFLLGSHGTIINSTIAENVLGSDPLGGQAISVVPHPKNARPSSADIEYSIIADHTSLTNVPAVKVQSGCSASFLGGLFAGNDLDTNSGSVNSGSFSGLGTVLAAVSAKFVSPGSPNFDYHLQSASPAIDQASGSTTELDVDQTVRTSPRDIGADEYCSATANDITLSGDVVTNSRVEQACNTISTSSYTVKATGSVLFQAGKSVALGNGFQVEAGGQLQVVIALP